MFDNVVCSNHRWVLTYNIMTMEHDYDYKGD